MFVSTKRLNEILGMQEDAFHKQMQEREAAYRHAMREIRELFERPFVDTRNIIEIIEREIGGL